MTSEYHPEIIGGLGTVATALTHALSSRYARATVWSASSSPNATKQQDRGISVLRLPRSPQYYQSKAFSYKRIAELSAKYKLPRPHLIHIHSLEFADAALAFKRAHGTPVVYTCHSLIDAEGRTSKQRISRRLQEQLFRLADRIVVPSRWLQREVERRYPKTKGRTVVIPHGVSPVSGSSRVPLHKLLYVGRLLVSKGIDPLIEAVADVRRTHPDIHLTLVGDGPVRYRDRLRRLAASRGIASRVQMRGFLPHDRVKRLYRSYGAVIVPSRQESFCMVALEAMASGVPLISTRAGGLREFVYSSHAMIIRSTDRRAIAAAIRTVLANPELTKRRASAARKHARRYSWPATARRYAALFERLLASRGSRRRKG